MTERRVTISQYQGLYYRIVFEAKHSQASGAKFQKWHQERANVICDEQQIGMYTSNWIQSGRVDSHYTTS